MSSSRVRAVCALVAAASVAFTVDMTSAGGVDVVTYHNDVARTGQNLNETVLTPTSVNATTFGKLGFLPGDGKVDAQPLFLSGVSIPGRGTRNIVYAVTEHDSVLRVRLGIRTGALVDVAAGVERNDERRARLLAGHPGDRNHGDAGIDRSRGPNGAIYVVTMSKTFAGALRPATARPGRGAWDRTVRRPADIPRRATRGQAPAARVEP